jgi:hypothetical protein
MVIERTCHGILQRLAALVPRRAMPRRTRLYGVGAPRTGTHSLAAIFDRSVRARHEPELRFVAQLVLAHHRGELPFDELRRVLRTRDERLRLDVDASHANVFLVAALLAEFADARFVLTIRDCFSWTDSAMNHVLNSRRGSAADRQYLDFWLAPGARSYSKHDAFLRDRDLPSVDGWFATWARHNMHVLESVPPDRLLVVRTHELAMEQERIATFAGLPASCIARTFRTRGAARAKHDVLAAIDPTYVADRAAAHCGALMRRVFPSVHSLHDANELTSAT